MRPPFTLLLLLALTSIGGAAGFLLCLQIPDTYRSTTRLMLEQDSVALGTAETERVLMSFEVLQSLLYSEKVISLAFSDPRLEPFRKRLEGNRERFGALVQTNLLTELEVSDYGRTHVFLMHYTDSDPELTEAVVKCYRDAARKFIDEKGKDSEEEQIQLIGAAIEELHAKITKLERAYNDFVRDAPEAMGPDGKAVNLYRERQSFLTQRRSELHNEHRQKQIKLEQVESVVSRADDPGVAFKVVDALLDHSLSLRNLKPTIAPPASIGKQLVDAIAERDRIAKERGEDDPLIKKIDATISELRVELKELAIEQIDSAFSGGPPRSSSVDKTATNRSIQEQLAAVVYVLTAEVNVLQTQISEVDDRLSSEKVKEAKLWKFESEHQAMIREIEKHKTLMNQLEEQMTLAKLDDQQESAQLVELSAPTEAYLLGPLIAKLVGVGAACGFVIAALLAIVISLVTHKRKQHASDNVSLDNVALLKS